MESNYKPIGEYIHLIDNRNTDLSVNKLVGLTVEKKFIPSVANIIGTDLSKYKVIGNHQFACSLMQVSRDKKMPVAMYKGNAAIMSPAYPMFEVNEENELMPEYLHLYLSRSEFDREAVFYAIGGVRGSLDWEDFCNIKIPIPPISEQRRIVNEYQTMERRIANNEALIQKLEETAQAIYHHTFVEGIDEENLPKGWKKGIVKDFGKVVTGTTPSCEHPEYFGDEYMFVTPADYYNYEKYLLRTERGISYEGDLKMLKRRIPKESLLVTCIGSNMGRVCINKSDCYTNQQINSVILNFPFYKDYLYYYIKSQKEALQGYAVGSSAVPLLNKSQFETIEVMIPSEELLKKFSKEIYPINQQIKILSKEKILLEKLLTLLTSKLA